MAESAFRIYRRNLPHWRSEDAVYFVTWRMREAAGTLTSAERTIALETLRFFHGRKFHLHAAVIMDDHLHLLVSMRERRKVENIICDWKSFSTRRFWFESGREGSVWLDEYLCRIMRSPMECDEKLAYIAENPRKRWPDIEEYPWLFFGEDD